MSQVAERVTELNRSLWEKEMKIHSLALGTESRLMTVDSKPDVVELSIEMTLRVTVCSLTFKDLDEEGAVAVCDAWCLENGFVVSSYIQSASPPMFVGVRMPPNGLDVIMKATREINAAKAALDAASTMPGPGRD